MRSETNDREERPRRPSRSRNAGFPVGPALGVVALISVAYLGSQLIAEGAAPPPKEQPAYVPFADVPAEAPPDPSNRPAPRWVNNAPEGLAGSSLAFAAARRLAAQGEKFLVDARSADAAGEPDKARALRKQAHTAYNQAFEDTAAWEMEIENKYTDRDRQVENIKTERTRWMQRIIALHKTTGR